jgi:hypothetical protein
VQQERHAPAAPSVYRTAIDAAPTNIRYRAIVCVRVRVCERDIGLCCMCVNRSMYVRYVFDARRLNSVLDRNKEG